MSALSERVPRERAAPMIVSQGWTRRAMAISSGAVGALAMAPFNIFPALIITFSIAVWLVDGAAQINDSPRS